MPAGLILAVVVVGWLVYVVVSVKRRDEAEILGVGTTDSIGETMVVIRSGQDDIAANPDPALQVSTPLLRDAARHEIALAARTATLWRRRGLVVAVAVALGIIAGVVFAPAMPVWWLAAVPGTLLVWGFLARVSLVAGRRRRDRRLAELDHGWDDQTQLITVNQAAEGGGGRNEMSVDLSAPLQGGLASLLEPLPVTPPTYVSKPLLPRSQRTVDLSAPQGKGLGFPVTAEPPQDALPFDWGGEQAQDGDDDSGELPQAVGA